MNSSNPPSSQPLTHSKSSAWLTLGMTIIISLIFFAAHFWAKSQGWQRIAEIYPELTGTKVRPLAVDPQGRIWVNSTDQLMVREADGEWTSFLKGENNINDIAFDSQSQAWIARHYGGLSVLAADGSLTTYTSDSSGLIHDLVWTVAIDPAGQVWAGTLEGISRLSTDGKWRTFLPNMNVHSLVIDAQGVVWAGTNGDGLHGIYPDGHWQVYTTSNSGLADPYTNELAIDPQGGVWTGSQFSDRGLSQLTPQGEWKNHLPGQTVELLSIDQQGTVWAAYRADLYALCASGVWRNYTPTNSGLSNGWIEALLPLPDGSMWIGTTSGMVLTPSEMLPPGLVFGLLLIALICLTAFIIQSVIHLGFAWEKKLLSKPRQPAKEPATISVSSPQSANRAAEPGTASANGEDIPLELPPELPPAQAATAIPLTMRMKWTRFAIGFLGWFLVNGLVWLLFASRGGIDFEGNGLINCLMLPLNFGGMLALSLKPRTRFLGLGILTALAVNLLVSLFLGLANNAGCFIPFFIEFSG